MKIIKPYMRMLTSGGVVIANSAETTDGSIIMPPLNFVNWCGRISHRSEDTVNVNVERFLRNVVIEKGDWSIVEHASITVDAVVDRGITHEIVRHRIAAYTQESTRFVNYVKKMPPAFIYPQVGVECPHCLTGKEPRFLDAVDNRPHHPVEEQGAVHYASCPYSRDWLLAIQNCERSYQALLSQGWRPQEARSVFPNALASRIVITYNLRTWRHFFLMRTSKEAHPQMRQVTIPLLAEFKKRIPVLYEDIEPEQSQAQNFKLGR